MIHSYIYPWKGLRFSLALTRIQFSLFTRTMSTRTEMFSSFANSSQYTWSNKFDITDHKLHCNWVKKHHKTLLQQQHVQLDKNLRQKSRRLKVYQHIWQAMYGKPDSRWTGLAKGRTTDGVQNSLVGSEIIRHKYRIVACEDQAVAATSGLTACPSVTEISSAAATSLAGEEEGGVGICFSFTKIWRILERSVGFPGFGLWITTNEGFCYSFFPLFSLLAISLVISLAIAFQYCLSTSVWNFSRLERYS